MNVIQVVLVGMGRIHREYVVAEGLDADEIFNSPSRGLYGIRRIDIVEGLVDPEMMGIAKHVGG